MKIQLMALAAVILISLPAEAQDVSGKWEGTADGRNGNMNMTFEFELDGENLTGTVESERTGDRRSEPHKSEITDGKVDGNKIEFQQSVDFRGRTRTFAFTGLLDGDKLQMTRTFEGGRGRGRAGGRGRGPGRAVKFTLTRVP